MRNHSLRGCLALAAVGLAGCGGPVILADAPEDASALGDKTDVALATWLKLPRAEQAELVAEWSERVKKQREDAADHPESVELLPDLRPPATLPVFREAVYSEKAGISLPPYLKPGDKDAGVALHLARLGDAEAARKVGDPDDRVLINYIETQPLERNYPEEWTQLVGLVVQSAELELAAGQKQGAVDLIQTHRQLGKVLDVKAAAGPLGAALLPLGRRALTDAAAAWRAQKVKKVDFAAGVEAALKSWGEVPAPASALKPGDSRDAVARLLQTKGEGRIVAVEKPTAVHRALDVLSLPAPSDGAAAVAAFFSADEQLTEIVVLYRFNAAQLFPKPENVANALLDFGIEGASPSLGGDLTTQDYSGGGGKYTVGVLTRCNAFGAFFRLSDGKEYGAELPPRARDFGGISLDRSFEANRILLAAEKAGPSVTVSGRFAAGRVAGLVPDPAPSSVSLRKEKDYDLVDAFKQSWSELEPASEIRLILGLWATYGPSGIAAGAGSDGEATVLSWTDARTRLTLRFPAGTTAADFIAEDRRGGESLAKRTHDAQTVDQTERKRRLDANKPSLRLARSLQLDDVQLGVTRAKVLERLPKKASVRRFDLGSDVSLVFNDARPKEAAYGPRQMFLRFGRDDRLVEIRVRYQEGAAGDDKNNPTLSAKFAGAYGAPQESPAPWADLWTELPAQDPPATLARWRDDRTVLTLQRDGGGAEAILRDWPPDRTLADVNDQLPPLTFCDRGAGGVALGDAKADVLKKFPNSKPLDDGGLGIPAAAGGVYDGLAVWFEGDKVARVVAQHAAKPTDGGDANARVSEAWGRDFNRLGWPRRQDGAAPPLLTAFAWHDDRVRVRTLAEEKNDGLRLYTEWRTWPAAKP
jgi:hypothetical protein